MTAINRRHFVGGLTAATFILPAHAANGYRAYAEAMLANPPRGAVIRPDLEQYLDLLAAEARYRARRTPVEGSDLLRDMARAQALEMVKGNFVGHKSASGHSFRARFEAFADPDQRGDFGENAARDRQRGEVDKEKARRLFLQWMDSAGHKRNMMNRWYRFVSTGAAQVNHHLYAVQIFWER
ncbi:MAG: CAP domain-containing protein [Anderseniella sp.]|jgi:uncharacterized protein YkwD|nr:CAP domain-containing protein [Anderseniella sp.]